MARTRGGQVLAVGLSVVLAATMADWVRPSPAQAAPKPTEQPAQTSSEVLERPDEAAAVATARLSGKKVRITGMTSETSEFWALPDGRVEAEVHSGPVRVRDQATGGWKPVDFGLAVQADGSVTAKAHPNALRLSGTAEAGEHDLVTLGQAGESVSLGWSGPLPTPTVSGNRATYAEVRPGVDLVVESTRTGFEQYLIVKNRDAVAEVSSVALPFRGDGLTVVDDERGGFEIRNGAGQPVGVSPQPIMWDAQVHAESGERLRFKAVDRVVSQTRAQGAAVTLTPDEQWLTDPETQFPVTIDPGVTLTPNYDAFVQSNISSDQSAGTELKLGTFDGGTTVARSFVRFGNLDWLQGKHVQAATIYLWNHHSWSCDPRQWETWQTLFASTATRWSNQPQWRAPMGLPTATKGYSGCGAGWVNGSATTAFAEHANGVTCCTVTVGLRAGSETDNFSWKKFHSSEGANGPYVSLTYQSKPTVTARATVPSTPCATGTSTPYINSKTPQLRAQVSDAEGSQVRAEFEWLTGGGTSLGTAIVGPGASGSWLAASVPAGVFAEGGTYSWRVRGNDGLVDGAWTGYCAMKIDTIAPSAMPTVSSTDYPTNDWAGDAGTAGSFTFGAAGVTDVAAYEYGLNVNPPDKSVTTSSLGANATASITPTTTGPQILYVRSRDRAGNVSAVRTYPFSVGAGVGGAVTSPKEGDITAAKTALTATGKTTATSATYQWRRADVDAWANIPTGHVTLAAGGGPVTWPIATTGNGEFAKINWDVEATLTAADPQSVPRDGPLQVRAVFNSGTSEPVKISFDRTLATAAAEAIGPGTVNLITGNFTLTDTDVAASSFESSLVVSRSYNTRRSTDTDTANMFGPGWVSSVEVERADSPYTSLHVYGSLVQIGTREGNTIGFTARGTSSFDAEIGHEALKLVYASANDAYTLTNSDGSAVVFTRLAGTAAGAYFPTSVTVPAGQTTSLSWEKVTIGTQEVIRPTRLLAAVAEGVTCVTVTRGCRAVNFTYATTTTATGTTEAAWGDHVGRLREVSYTAWDSDLATPAVRTVAMARYTYDNTGRLRAVWDPRQDWNDSGTIRHAWISYDYNADGVLSSVKPKGQEPWTLSYTTVPGDPGKGRLHQVSRSALAAGTAVDTVVYKVPVSGAGAPYDLSPTQTNRWGQTEQPTDATAIFPADQIPSGNPATGVLPTSYERATVTYLDANARSVNVAKPGSHITTTWYDIWGNTVRTLTAANRQRALDSQAADDAAAETVIARSHSSLSVYSPDGQRLDSTLDPEHDVMLPDGETVRGRKRTKYTYDQGAPAGAEPYNLVTTKDEMVRVWHNDGTFGDFDVRTSTTAYDWDLEQPTVETTDAGGLALTTRTQYDSVTGSVTSTTNPAGGTSVNTPSTRKVVYYRAGSGSGYSECDNRPEWVAMPCREESGGQPSSGPDLPAKVTTYDMFGQPRVVTEKAGTTTLRTTTTTYDAAGRVYEKTVTASAALGTPVPTERNVYDPATGLLTRTQSVTGGTVTAEVVREYDGLGRLVSYEDADGVTATRTYDLRGRVATTNDGKATRTYTYDGGNERRGLLTSVADTQAGTFGASYDADGDLVSETWPNGIVVTRTTDETGTPDTVAYTKPGCAAADCTLFLESSVLSIHQQVRETVSTLSQSTYTYDQAGRLTGSDTIRSNVCTSARYTLATASNRTGWTTYAADTVGGCATDDVLRNVTWSYDQADRLSVASGYDYDALGRTTTLPGADTANAGAAVTLAYHVNDYVQSISQSAGGLATYTVDVTGERLRTWSDNRSGTIVQSTHHYDGDGDNPSWTQETAARYTRPVAGVAGVAGDFDSGTGEIRWRISNLHDDVVASVQGNAEGLSEVSEFNEHGLAQEEGVTGVQRYGWLGAKQRAADTPTGLVLMGVRLYNPYTGRFLSQDPVQGGNANPYEYCFGDPIGCADLSGKGSSCRWPNCGRVINMHVWPLKIARDRCGRISLCPWTGTKWLQLYQSSRRYYQDTDSYRFFGIWYPIQNKWTAVGHGTYHYRYPHA